MPNTEKCYKSDLTNDKLRGKGNFLKKNMKKFSSCWEHETIYDGNLKHIFAFISDGSKQFQHNH